MLRMVGCAVLCSLAFGFAAVAQDAATVEAEALQNGEYELRLITPQMSKVKKDISLPAEVEVKNDYMVIHTEGMSGNKVTLKGIMSDGTIKVGMTDVEKSSVLSFHYIGKVESKQQAKGKFHCFIDGKSAFAGEWVLTKREMPKKAE